MKQSSRLPILGLFFCLFFVTHCGGSSSGNSSESVGSDPGITTGSTQLSGIWAQEGGDKVVRSDLRATSKDPSTINSVWDGQTITLFGARNEVVNFDLILEAAQQEASVIQVEFNRLVHENSKSEIANVQQNTLDLFDWTGRPIELFYVRYLQIKGKSAFMSNDYDQRHLPKRWRLPHDDLGIGAGTWQDRPDHDKYYPDIAVPLELEQGFKIQKGQNQSIWADIYIPKTAAAGEYRGTITVAENGEESFAIPVALTVYDFALPDIPTAKTMLVLGYSDVRDRFIGEDYSTANELAHQDIRDEFFKMAHRHKISLIDSDAAGDQPSSRWEPRLNGSLFTAANGYDGPGLGVGNNVYSVGTYGSWSWQNEGKSGMWSHTDAWMTWFASHAPDTEAFLYLIDESSNYTLIEKWASWMNENPGPGRNLLSMATMAAPDALALTPSLDVPTSGMYVGITDEWNTARDHYVNADDKRLFMYNSGRPAVGSFMTEDDGVALRMQPWAQYKMGVDRWFYWESTYYNNFQGGTGQTNVFESAFTFGGKSGTDEQYGETGWNYSNGDGVLFYPGTDKVFPEESYDIPGPIASLRLKYWRRGIQDVDYIALAMQKNPAATQAIIQKMIPKVLWEYGVADLTDPSWVRTPISWSDDPNDWEEARRALAEIIIR